jgi:hypothetical protein
VGDQRLQEIKNLTGTSIMSKFDYTYNPVGTIATWTQQTDSNTAVVNTLSYDGADQEKGTGTISMSKFDYTYNAVGTIATSRHHQVSAWPCRISICEQMNYPVESPKKRNCNTPNPLTQNEFH